MENCILFKYAYKYNTKPIFPKGTCTMKQHNTTKIGVVTATIIGMNAMIGSGIFTAPAIMASNVGPAGILAYFFVVVAIWFMALSLARLAQLFPEEGSFYTYARQWGGHTIGIIAISSYFIGLIIAMGLLAQIAGSYLQCFFPSMSVYTLGILTIITLTFLNMFGVVLSKLGQHILIALTLFPLIVTTLLCLTKINIQNLFPFAPHGFTNVMKATRIVIFGFFGFECATSLFNIVKNPEKNVPRALTYSILLVGSLYTLFIGAIIFSTPLHLFVDASVPLSEILQKLFPDTQWLIWLIHISILSAVLGTIHSMIWASSNLLLLITKKLKSKTIHNLITSGFITTQSSVIIIGLAIFLSYISIKNLGLFFYLTAIFIVLAFILSMITLLTIKQEWQSRRNITTIFGIITALAIFIFAVEGLVQEMIKSLSH